MGRLRGRAAALAAAALLCLSLTACGETKMTVFDATAYVKGVLDETYKGTWNNAFLDLVELTDGEAQDAYEASLEQEYRRFAYQFDLDESALTEETRQAVLDLLAEVCAKAQYSVQEAVPLDDTRYAVEVSVRPLDLFLQVRGTVWRIIRRRSPGNTPILTSTRSRRTNRNNSARTMKTTGPWALYPSAGTPWDF